MENNSKLPKLKILVTGTAGFIGFYLARKLLTDAILNDREIKL